MKYLGDESSVLEFKRGIPAKDQIIKTIIGFCNRNGGKLVLGVESDGTIIGVPQRKVLEFFSYMNKEILDATSPPILSSVYSQRVGDKLILIIEVSSGVNKPYYRKSEGLHKGTYIRLRRSTVHATADMIEELKCEKGLIKQVGRGKGTRYQKVKK